VLYHELLGQENLAELLEHAADAVVELVPCSALLIAEVAAEQEQIVPVLVRGAWGPETLQLRPRIGEGLLGWTVANAQPVLANEAHLDPRAGHVGGTPEGEPEAIICLPLVNHGEVIGALSLYREGAASHFSSDEFTLAQRFADAVTLALANAKARTQLEDLSRTDELTGCLNRRGFLHRFAGIAEACRQAEQALGLLLIDLDDFKAINDQFGHKTGDLLLQHVAHQLRASTPDDGCLARLGGGAGGLLFPPPTPDTARLLCAAATDAIATIAFLTPKGAVSISASIGATVTETGQATATELLDRADQEMYESKPQTRDATPRGRRSRRDRAADAATRALEQ